MSNLYEQRALEYAERYGIVKYTVKGNIMTYKVSFRGSACQPHYTVKRTVNLDTGEVKSEMMQRYSKEGEYNR
jgi:hypothetical protein